MLQAPPHRPVQVGIFDSGIGGLSVLRAVRAALPGVHCTYVADARHTPWGDRSAAWVTERCTQLAGWLIGEGADLVLVACNTATTQAIAALRARWPALPFVGVEPGVKPAAAASRNRRVAVMATTGTLRSARLGELVERHAGDATVLRLPCPGLADAIEAADHDEPALAAQLDAIAERLRASGADTVVLGCTHYPLVADALQQRLRPGTTLVDTAAAVARRVATLLPVAAVAPPAPPPRLLSTARAEALAAAARRWIAPSSTAALLALPDPDADPRAAPRARPRRVSSAAPVRG